MPKSMKWIFAIMLCLLVILAIAAASNSGRETEKTVTDDTIKSHVIDYDGNEVGETETTPAPTPMSKSYEQMYDSDIFWLARIIQAEGGAHWSDEDYMKLGEVALNRVASPDFPNTVKEVALQDGQYEPFFNYEFWIPDPVYIWYAARLMNGERVLNDPDVVWQALFVQGDEVVDVIYDQDLNNITYLCK